MNGSLYIIYTNKTVGIYTMKKFKCLTIIFLIIIIGNCSKEKKHYNPASNNSNPKIEREKRNWISY